MAARSRTSVRERTPHVLLTPASYAQASDPNKFIRMVRDSPKRIREMQKRGFVSAKPEDLAADHDCFDVGDGAMRNGDLVAMVGDRELLERERKRKIVESRAQDKKVNAMLDKEFDLETDNAHHKQFVNGEEVDLA